MFLIFSLSLHMCCNSNHNVFWRVKSSCQHACMHSVSVRLSA